MPQPVAFLTLYATGWVAVLTILGLYRPRARWSLLSEARDVLRATAVMALATISVLSATSATLAPVRLTVTVIPGDGPAVAHLSLEPSGAARLTKVIDQSGEVVPTPSASGRHDVGRDDLLDFRCGPVDPCVRTYRVTFETTRDTAFEGNVLVSTSISYDGPAPADSSIHVVLDP